MLVDLVRGALGVVILLGSAYLLVRGAVAVATAFGLSRVVIGATVVAVGTSAPEVVVSVLAALRDAEGVAVGNVVGSNVANVGLVLGLAALIAPIGVHSRLLRWELPALVGATLLVLLLSAGGGLAQREGLILLAALGGFVFVSLRFFPEVSHHDPTYEVAPHPPPERGPLLFDLVLIALGIGGLMLGADQIVAAATSVAASLGMSDFVIGVTLVAVGTSLPELATTVLAAARREHEIAVANIVGSNIFNLLGVLGLTALAAGVRFDRALYQFEMPMLALSAIVLVPVIWPGYRVVRLEGALLLAGYAVFVLVTLMRG